MFENNAYARFRQALTQWKRGDAGKIVRDVWVQEASILQHFIAEYESSKQSQLPSIKLRMDNLPLRIEADLQRAIPGFDKTIYQRVAAEEHRAVMQEAKEALSPVLKASFSRAQTLFDMAMKKSLDAVVNIATRDTDGFLEKILGAKDRHTGKGELER